MYLNIANQQFDSNEIKQGNFTLEGDDFVDNILVFCFEWLNGKEEFTLQTSGSTGTPKSITVTRNQMISSASATIKILNLKSGDKALCCLNTDYIAGKMMIVRSLVADMNLWIVPPSAHPFKHPFLPHFDFVALAPLQVQSSLDVPSELEQIQSVKNIIIGGAPINSHLENRIIHQLEGVRVFMTYGMTESVSHIALKRIAEDSDQLYHTLEGVSIGQDDRGCLHITAPMTDFQKIQTNDVVQLINRDTFEWLGRVDNIINSGGVKIQVEKIENAISKILETMGYASVNLFIGGIPHERLGEEANLLIEGITLTENEKTVLINELKAQFTKYKLPKNIHSLGEFVKTDTLKIKRKETVQLFLENNES
ncbi:AMP-binding protein [Flammeovirga sp. EKP202]|uniref:AMP-binding protein n=1 Tax=Flammeovirga sp. EKP202 TaxID=2770592 RepID=UPI00165FACCB|nr:AMP-binding protein [Flammeovirga sp. EKP202]MBD0403562.1 AMP-binding protein [Flammeovirga sp. EKP202]